MIPRIASINDVAGDNHVFALTSSLLAVFLRLSQRKKEFRSGTFYSSPSDRSADGHRSHYSVAPTTRRAQNDHTVAGGHGEGDSTHQLSWPHGLFVDDEDTLIIADWENNRIVEWKRGDTSGTVLAGGNGPDDRPDQLNGPTDVLVEKENNSLIICDRRNRRVTRWPRRDGTRSGDTIIDNIACVGLAIDDEGFLYVTDREKHEVRRYYRGETNGTVVAGGNGQGAGFHQLHDPHYICVDRENAIYVSDCGNHRVMKWVKNAKVGIIVAGGRGYGKEPTQVSSPQGVLVDAVGTVYVADWGNDRVMRWCRGATQGTVVVGGNGRGEGANQFNGPTGLSFDRLGQLYVSDSQNNRVQRFEINK